MVYVPGQGFFDANIAPYFFYTTPKRIKIRYASIGMTHLGLTIFLAIYYVNLIVESGQYLKKVAVTSRVNPFAITSTHPTRSCSASSTCTAELQRLVAGSYCNTPSHKFDYSADFVYRAAPGSPNGPQCRVIEKDEVSSKRANYISFSSVFTETHKFAWPLADNTSATYNAAMSQCDVAACVPDSVHPTQCTCTSTTSVFPAAIEDYSVQFDHNYDVNQLGSLSWTGSSTIANPTAPYLPTDTFITFPNGTVSMYRAGQTIQLTVREIVAMAGKTLDDDNSNATAEAGGTGRYPKFRHTGMSITFNLDYTNRGANELILSNDFKVDATATVAISSEGSWASVGPTTFYPTYPLGAVGAETYHRVIRYPQDIEINFAYTGYAYALNWTHLIETIVDVVVIFGIVKTLINMVIFFLLPNGLSTILKNKRDEQVSRETAFREMGMKACISVNQFNRISGQTEGDNVNLKDLTKVFGTVEGVNRDKAMKIAKTIIGKADKISFNQFMSITEGDKIDFDQFLKLIDITAKRQGSIKMSDKEDAMEAYDAVAEGIKFDDDEEAGGPPATPPSGNAPPQPQVAPQVAPPAGPQLAPMVGVQHIAQPPQQMMIQPPRPQMPPGVVKLACGTCRKHFGVPVGSKMVRCPHCGTVNNVSAAAAGPNVLA